MTRYYGKQKGKKSSRSHFRGTATVRWTWLFAGLLLGLMIAGVFYLKTHPKESMSAIKSIVAGKSHLASSPINKTKAVVVSKPKIAAAEEDKTAGPRFDFYTILPQAEVPVSAKQSTKAIVNNEKTLQQNEATIENTANAFSEEQEEIETPNNVRASKVEPIKEKQIKTSSVYILQIASFANYHDADQLRATLVLQGFDPKIKTVKTKNGIYNRVWLGPFASASEAMASQQKLKENKVKSILGLFTIR